MTDDFYDSLCDLIPDGGVYQVTDLPYGTGHIGGDV